MKIRNYIKKMPNMENDEAAKSRITARMPPGKIQLHDPPTYGKPDCHISFWEIFPGEWDRWDDNQSYTHKKKFIVLNQFFFGGTRPSAESTRRPINHRQSARLKARTEWRSNLGNQLHVLIFKSSYSRLKLLLAARREKARQGVALRRVLCGSGIKKHRIEN